MTKRHCLLHFKVTTDGIDRETVCWNNYGRWYALPSVYTTSQGMHKVLRAGLGTG